MIYQEHSASRTMVGLTFVIALHVGIIVLFKNGLMRNVVPLLPPSFQTVFIEPMQPPPKPVEPPKPEIKTPVMEELPIVEVPIEIPAETIAVSPPEEVSEPNDAPSLASSELQVDPRYGLKPPEYPPQSLRMNESGSVVLLIYVLEDGRPGEVRIGLSSGYPRLDQSAMREAKRSWRFKPRIVDGQPVASWGRYSVKFQIQN